MPYLTSLPDILAAIESVSSDVRATFQHLSADRVNWKPNPDTWSVGQCLDHLINTNAPYFPIFDGIVAGTYRPPLVGWIPGLAALTGSLFLKAVDPASTGKVTAPAAFQPSRGTLPADIVARFLDHQEELNNHLRRLPEDSLAGTIVASPALAVATYSLLDALNILVRHERRHFNQAKRVTETAGFPA